MVEVRQVQERADGRYVRVRGPDGVVVLMAAWMFDPVACAAMTAGAPMVEWAALVELRQHLLDVRPNEAFANEATIVREEQDEDLNGSIGLKQTGLPEIQGGSSGPTRSTALLFFNIFQISNHTMRRT